MIATPRRCDNFFAQIVGAKRFVLISPEHSNKFVRGELLKVYAPFEWPRSRPAGDCDSAADGACPPSHWEPRQAASPLSAGATASTVATASRSANQGTGGAAKSCVADGDGTATQPQARMAVERVQNYLPFPLNAVDRRIAPLFHRVPRLTARVVPGDVLYIPYGWWHEVGLSY